MGFFQTVKVFLQTIWTTAFGDIIKIAVVNIAALYKSSILDFLSRSAEKKVAEMERYQNLSGEEKQKATKDYLIAVAASEGITVASAVINLIIEAAVVKIKGGKAD